MAILGINSYKSYEKLSWNDLSAIAVKRGIQVPPIRLVESYGRPTPREKLISELVAQDQKKWKSLLAIIGVATSIITFLKLIPFSQLLSFFKFK